MNVRAGSRVRVPRGVVVAAAVAAAALLAALAGGRPGRDGPPLDPRSDGPLGTSALVSLLEGLGSRVELSPGLPSPSDDIALVLHDRLDDGQIDALHRWVRSGGTLVVTDPSSPLTPAVVGGGSAPEGTLDPGACTISALRSIGTINGGAPVRFTVAESDDLCFGSRGTGAFVVTRALGTGQVAAVGGAAFVTNDLLGEADNAVLAATLLAPEPGGQVRFVDAPVPAGGGDKSLADLVPSGVKRALLQLAVAFVLYALWRAIRLGQPVAEDQPVELAGSELVAAIGRLLARTRSPGSAAETVRGALRRTLRARLGISADAPTDTLVQLTAARTATDTAAVEAAVGTGPVTTDAELVAVARAVASIHQEVPS